MHYNACTLVSVVHTSTHVLAQHVKVPEVGCSCHFECEAGEVDDTVGDQEEHGHDGSYGVQLAQE